MNNVNEIFSKQKSSIKCFEDKDREKVLSDESNHIVIRFGAYENYFAIDLKYVQEIIESIDITPYPEIIKNHIGIINLRGKTIPVIEISQKSNGLSSENDIRNQKVIIIEFSQLKKFAIRTHKVNKFTIKKEDFVISEQTVNVGSAPAFFLDENYFDKIFKDLTC